MLRILIIGIYLTACKSSGNKSSEYFIKHIERGTDSTFQREYDHHQNLLITSTSYHSAIYRTKISYFNQRPLSIKGYLIDSLYGHFFEFNSEGKLKAYAYYLGNNKHASLIRNYSEEGKLETEEGSPFVDSMYDEDTGSVDLFFSTVFCDSISVKFAFGKTKMNELKLKPSMLQAMLSEINLPQSDSNLYMEISTVERDGKQARVYHDTLIKR